MVYLLKAISICLSIGWVFYYWLWSNTSIIIEVPHCLRSNNVELNQLSSWSQIHHLHHQGNPWNYTLVFCVVCISLPNEMLRFIIYFLHNQTQVHLSFITLEIQSQFLLQRAKIFICCQQNYVFEKRISLYSIH